MEIFPLVTSYTRRMSLSKVLFPEPLGPTMPTDSPGFNFNDTPLSTSRPLPYLKVTSSSSSSAPPTFAGKSTSPSGIFVSVAMMSNIASMSTSDCRNSR